MFIVDFSGVLKCDIIKKGLKLIFYNLKTYLVGNKNSSVHYFSKYVFSTCISTIFCNKTYRV